MSFRIKKKDAEFIKGIARQLQRGYLSIMESEQSIACYITETTESIEDMEISQAEFAKRMGTTAKTLSQLINGQTNISNDLAKNREEFFSIAFFMPLA